MRKYYDNTKSGLFALGYLKNSSTYVTDLQRITNDIVTELTIDNGVKLAYEEERELNYRYNEQGNIEESDFDEELTCRYAIETGFMTMNTAPGHSPESIYAWYVRDLYGKWSGVYFSTKYQLENNLNAYRFGNISFRNYSEANNFVSDLAKKLLPGEVWKFKKTVADGYRPKTEFDILQNYLQFVFDKLLCDYEIPHSKNFGKIVFSNNNKYALFNTGLLSEFAQDIYLVGEVFNQQGNGSFTFSNPCIAPGKVDLIRSYGFSSKGLTPYPDVVEFFHHLNEIIFDAEVEIDLSPEKLEHIIKDGGARDRFPEKYKKSDFATIATTLKTAIENAQKIAKRNYKYVVPQYRIARYGEQSKIQFLMPIYLDSQYGKKPDFALVLNEEKIEGDRFYTPETVLELSWAYNNARVICKPEDTWLNPTSIESVPNSLEIMSHGEI